MTAKQKFITYLKQAISANGYWCDEVQNLNDDCCDTHGHHKWYKWHNEAKAQLHREKAI